MLLFSFGLMYQCLNRAIPSRKCSINAPAKWRNSVYILTEICHQRSKWLGAHYEIIIEKKLFEFFIFSFSPPPGNSDKERFRVQPGRIEDYSLGRGTIAQKEAQQVMENLIFPLTKPFISKRFFKILGQIMYKSILR